MSESVDDLLRGLTDDLAPEAAAVALAGLLNRGAARLHSLARTQAAAHKEQPEWPAWAQLQNASRSLILQTSTCRDLAAKLPGRPESEPEGDTSPA
jgi:hypothetical protein